MGQQNLVDLDEWREKARAGSAPLDVLLRKQFVPDTIKAAGERKLVFTISTASIDRDRDILRVEGWRLENYLKNPVVLWAHDYRGLPVGQAVELVASEGKLKATAAFCTAEEYAFGDTVFRLLQGGYLRATSVGFRPIKSLYNSERGGMDFEEQELLEFSIVPVPANPEALLDAKRAGIELAPLKAWAEQVLSAQEPGLWVPKAAAERVLRIAGGEPALVATAPAPPPDPQPVEKAFIVTPAKLTAVLRTEIEELVGSRVRRELGRLD